MKTITSVIAIIVGVVMAIAHVYFLYKGALILPCVLFFSIGILLIFIGYNTLKGNIQWEE